MLTRHSSLILGAGVTGLAAGLASGFPIYEAERNPGGICSSYYLQPGQKERLAEPPLDGQAYRFEIGGGHWIFGGAPVVLRFIQSLSPTKRYDRRSAVYFAETGLTIPYPIQNNLGYLDEHVAARALGEMLSGGSGTDSTMEGWLRLHFGPTLSELFFGPFHDRYTVGLWKRIAPQDPYKSPIQFSQVIEGAFRRAPSAGYNVTFAYALTFSLGSGSSISSLSRERYPSVMVRRFPMKR
jgi:protoporphyrinogen oxidase